MEFINDPQKAKNVFIVLIILAIVFFLSSSALGYSYYKKNKDFGNLSQDKDAIAAELEKAQSGFSQENEDLKSQIKEYQVDNVKAQAYTDVLGELVHLMNTNDEIADITEADFQGFRTKAVATGDTSFVAVIDWAWENNTATDWDKLVKILEGIHGGIDRNLIKD